MPKRYPALAMLTGVLAGAIAGPLQAGARAADRELGAYLSSECVSCHQNGGGRQGGIPAIAGWPQDRFAAALLGYRDGQRQNEVMQAVAARLSADDIMSLADYYGSLGATK